MWPCFAVFGAVFWWFLVHDDPETLGARGVRRQRRIAADEAVAGNEAVARDESIARAEADDPELAAYNAYLADLARRPASKGWRQR
jgi:hypothetical protein